VRQLCEAKPRTEPELTRRVSEYAAGYADARAEKNEKG
jgi:hypothetical protein